MCARTKWALMKVGSEHIRYSAWERKVFLVTYKYITICMNGTAGLPPHHLRASGAYDCIHRVMVKGEH